jgi:uroporphyrinogen decarboxylase
MNSRDRCLASPHHREPNRVPLELKWEFGMDLVFWGGGVDTQGIFTTASPQEIRDHVKENIEALAPGGGFVFATVHNTQANVPPPRISWPCGKRFGNMVYIIK